MKAYTEAQKVNEFYTHVDKITKRLGQSDVTKKVVDKILTLYRRVGQDLPLERAGEIAAGMIYPAGVLSHERRTQSQVAEAANVSENTLRTTYTNICQTIFERSLGLLDRIQIKQRLKKSRSHEDPILQLDEVLLKKGLK